MCSCRHEAKAVRSSNLGGRGQPHTNPSRNPTTQPHARRTAECRLLLRAGRVEEGRGGVEDGPSLDVPFDLCLKQSSTVDRIAISPDEILKKQKLKALSAG